MDPQSETNLGFRQRTILIEFEDKYPAPDFVNPEPMPRTEFCGTLVRLPCSNELVPIGQSIRLMKRKIKECQYALAEMSHDPTGTVDETKWEEKMAERKRYKSVLNRYRIALPFALKGISVDKNGGLGETNCHLCGDPIMAFKIRLCYQCLKEANRAIKDL